VTNFIRACPKGGRDLSRVDNPPFAMSFLPLTANPVTSADLDSPWSPQQITSRRTIDGKDPDLLGHARDEVGHDFAEMDLAQPRRAGTRARGCPKRDSLRRLKACRDLSVNTEPKSL